MLLSAPSLNKDLLDRLLSNRAIGEIVCSQKKKSDLSAELLLGKKISGIDSWITIILKALMDYSVVFQVDIE